MNEFVITINGRKKEVKVHSNGDVELNGKRTSASIMKISAHSYVLRYGNNIYEAAINSTEKNKFRFLVDGWYFDSIVRTKLQETAFELQKNKEKLFHHSDVKAPMPGLLLKILKNVGDPVELGEPILILEAMKMENELKSPSSGIIKEIFYSEGQSVEKDSVILSIE